MMLITDIVPSGKKLCQVFCDGEKYATVYVESVVLAGIKKGDTVSEETLCSLCCESDSRRAYERALFLLEYRPHSVREMYDKLKKNYPDEICDSVCARLAGNGLLCDRDYAEMLVRDMLTLKKYGVQRIKAELSRRGIPKEIATETIDAEISEDTLSENIIKLIETKYIKIMTDESGTRRAVNALLRRGYSYGEIRDALRKTRDGLGCDLEE